MRRNGFVNTQVEFISSWAFHWISDIGIGTVDLNTNSYILGLHGIFFNFLIQKKKKIGIKIKNYNFFLLKVRMRF